MPKSLPTTAAILLLLHCALLPAEDQKETIKKHAQACCAAIAAGDFKKLLDYTHPKIIELGGGKDAMLKLLKSSMEEVKNDGYEIKSATADEVLQVETAGDNTFAVVSTTLELTHQKEKIVTKSYFLGVSSDNGKTWKFIDGSKIDAATLKDLDLKLPDSLKLPDKTEPVVTKK